MTNINNSQLNREHGDIIEAYRLNVSQAINEYKSFNTGLTNKEATSRLELDGYNKLIQGKKDKLVKKFLRQFKDLMLILLIFSGIFSLYVGEPQTATILFAIVIVNALIGFTQEFKAEKLMESLEKLVIPTAKVLRDDTIQEIPSANIVTGDVIVLEEGDSVPADARIIEESELSTNDFALTGESNPSRKFTHAIEGNVLLANRHNLVFMGTTVATGSAKCIVIATGMQTELGRIARLSQGTKNDLSPLQKEMTSLAVTLTKAALILTAILMAIAWQGDTTLKEVIIFAVGVASALIPQGLPAEVNTALASAAGRLAKARVLVKKLSAVETLGATSVILTDKTGTLTKNEMTVQQLRIGDDIYNVTGIGYENNGTIFDSDNSALSSKDLKDNEIFFVTGFFASNASVHPPDESHANWFCIGDPTEGSLITLASKARLDVNSLSTIKEQHEYSFDSVRKRMSSVRVYNNELTVFVKGAPESVLQECTHYISNGVMRVFTNAHKNEVLAQDDEWAKNAMRNLAFAYKTIPHDTKLSDYTMQDAESKLIFLGIASMIDPPREEVNAAMQAARDAYVPVNIITGDNALTAKAVAVKAGFAKDPKDIVLVTGSELSSMSDSDVIKLVTIGGTIFSRVAPEDKLRIVELAKQSGLTVAVTGDGINDAPALKRADIGVAMGKTGTDVAKQSAEIILLDDSFKTLVGAIQAGRVIYQNIKKAALSAISSNFGELVVVLISLIAGTLLGIPPAISVILILAIDLMAELFPIAALGWDKAEQDLMHQKPRKLTDHILNKRNLIDLIITGIIMGVLGYINYLLFFARNDIAIDQIDPSSSQYFAAATLTYLTIVFCQFGNILLRRIKPGNKLLTTYLWSNVHLLLAFGLSLLLIIFIIYIPFLQPFFTTGAIGMIDWLYAIVAAVIFVTLKQTYNIIFYRLKNKTI